MKETYVVNNLELSIFMDEMAESPREWDNLGTMICFHRRYSLGDSHNFSAPDEVNLKEYAVVIPLYLYDHSGITMATRPFSCQWDSGQVGWIVVTAEEIRKNFGVKRITKKILEHTKEILISEVEVYDHYLTGNVHGFSLEKISQCECCDQDVRETIDSCFGFYGDIKESGILEHIPEEFHDQIS
jgi:hypothetical protein